MPYVIVQSAQQLDRLGMARICNCVKLLCESEKPVTGYRLADNLKAVRLHFTFNKTPSPITNFTTADEKLRKEVNQYWKV